jgi:hypothetical protein
MDLQQSGSRSKDRARRTLRRLGKVRAGTAFVLVLAMAGGAFAATGGTPGPGSVLHGCVNKKTGALRVAKMARGCKRQREFAVSWNQRGPQGVTGPQGPRGLQGPAGTNGTNGTNGINGAANAFQGLGGAPGSYLGLASIPTIIATVGLPVGNYVLQADLHVEWANGDTRVTCDLDSGGTIDESIVDTTSAGLIHHDDMALGGEVKVTGKTSAAVISCSPQTAGDGAVWGRVIATQVTNAS